MDVSRRSVMLSSALAAGTGFVLAACGSDSNSDSGSDAGSDASSSSVVLANGSEPQNKLIPTATNETGGGKILDCLFAGLVYYDAKGESHNEMAESIESDDSQTWTIKIKSGWKFTDGEEITVQNYIDAWNYGANVNNAQNSAYFFEPVEGYADVSAEGAAADATMSGLKKVDDTTLEVKLTSPQSDFPLRLGYTAYSPLPSKAYDDMDAYGEAPASNGPYKIEDGGWDHNVSATLTVNEDYQGERKPQNGGVTFTFYQDPDTAYNDLQSGSLMVIDQIPTSAFPTFEDDLGDRAVNQPAAIFQSFTIHQELEHWAGDEGKLRRQALSKAIDRPSICKAIFSDTRTPAKDFSSPVINGYSDSLKGADVLDYDEAAAKELWAQAEAIAPYGDTTFTIAYNADGGHKEWVDAVCNSIANVLGIKAQGESYPDFKSSRDKITKREMTGGFRSGWQADYPSLYNFLGPLYGSGAADGNGSNDGDYKSEAFDKLLSEGLAETDVDAGLAKFQEAEQLLFEELPAIPLWYSNVTGGYAEGVSGVEFGWNSVPLFEEIVPSE